MPITEHNRIPNDIQFLLSNTSSYYNNAQTKTAAHIYCMSNYISHLGETLRARVLIGIKSKIHELQNAFILLRKRIAICSA
jgi:hypothetical protein